jgi:hypothetical protein
MGQLCAPPKWQAASTESAEQICGLPEQPKIFLSLAFMRIKENVAEDCQNSGHWVKYKEPGKDQLQYTFQQHQVT